MSLNKTFSIVAALAAAGTIATASAQDLSKQGKALVPNLPQVPNLDPARLKPDYPGGAAAWISPMLVNAPGTIGGERFTVDGKRVVVEFGFSMVNGNGRQTANANLICFDAGGRYVPRYNQTFIIPPLGAANWESKSVTPPATTDGATQDRDEIWCAINADTPIYAFGWSQRQFGQDENRRNITLERASPAGN